MGDWRVFVEGTNDAVTLGHADFVAEGGQGKVFARGDVAYKIFADPGQLPPAGKLTTLRAIAHPRVLVPQRRLLDAHGQAVGYTLPFAADAWPLCAMFPAAFRRRNHIGPDAVRALVGDLQAIVEAVHRAGALVVDLNEMNFLVGPLAGGGLGVYAIDTDSYQTPGYPATALSERVRDRQSPSGEFSEGTDWFAFAIITFQMFRGVHPYQGKHPTLKGLDARMKAGVSVLSPDVRVPKAALPPDMIPDAWRGWYAQVFESGHRGPPPPMDGPAIAGTGGRAQVAPMVPKAPQAGAEGITLQPLQRLPEPILTWRSTSRGPVTVTTDQVYLDARPVMATPSGPWTLALTPRGGRPVLAWLSGDRLAAFDLVAERPIPLTLHADALAPGGDAIVFRSGRELYTLNLIEAGPQIVAAPQALTTVMPLATTLLHQCALDRIDGVPRLHLFPRPGQCHTLPLPELAPYRVLDGAYRDGVVMLMGHRDGQWDRITIRCDFPRQPGVTPRYDLKIDADVDAEAISFAVLDTGVVITTDGAGLTMYRAKVGDGASRHVDAALPDGCQLYSRDEALIVCGAEGDRWGVWRGWLR